MGGRGRLTKIKIDFMQKWYRKAIRGHKTVEGMRKAIMATFYHLTSTDEHPMHHYCQESWCFYLQLKAKDEEAMKKWDEDVEKSSSRGNFYSKKNPTIKKPIPSVINHEKSFKVSIAFEKNSPEWHKLKSKYEVLADEELLARCLTHKTQNPNESFHSRMWCLCPKQKYATLPVLRFAIAQAVLWSHKGYYHGGLHKKLGITMTKEIMSLLNEKEWQRLRNRDPKARKKLELPTKGGIPDYKAGGFLNLPGQQLTVASDIDSEGNSEITDNDIDSEDDSDNSDE